MNQDRLDDHIQNHFQEYEFTKAEEYVELARELLAAEPDDDVDGFISEDGDVYKYRKSTNDYTIGSAEGVIRTLYKPEKKEVYWNGKKRKNDEKM